MKQYPTSRVNVSWKPAHMVNSGCAYGTKGAGSSKTASAYVRWWGMFARCYKQEDPGYARYGARGVTVSEEWGNYQDFSKWYYTACEILGIDPENNSYDLDKDTDSALLCYGPQTCTLIPVAENVSKATSKYHKYIDPSGNIVEIYNLFQFCKDNGLSRRQMYRLRYGTCKSHKGWRVVE